MNIKNRLAAALLLLSSPGFACTLQFVDTQELRSVTDANGGYPVTLEQCQFLSKRGLALHVSGHASVFGGGAVATAWAQVRLTNAKLGVVSNSLGAYNSANTANPTGGTANAMLYTAIREAIARLDFVTAAQQVDAYVAKRK